MSTLGLCVFAAIVSACLSGSNGEADAGLEGKFLPAWDVTCGSGRDLVQGCDAVRARDIVDASQFPWRAIGRVNFAGHRTRSHCTGALINERIVLTAAHCLFDDIRKRWLLPDSIHFLAGYQRGAHVAHSVAARYVVSGSYDTGGRRHRLDPALDWALIELREPIGAKTGYLGWQQLGGAGLQAGMQAGGRIALAGYPALRPHVLSVNKNCGGAHFRKSGTGVLIGVQCAAMSGDSGAPVLFFKNGQPTIVAILSGGRVESGKLINIATPVSNFQREIRKALGEGASQ